MAVRARGPSRAGAKYATSAGNPPTVEIQRSARYHSPTVSHAKARDAAFEAIIGGEYESFVDDREEPHIEVRRYRGQPVKNGPECDVWVTSGMSDVEMTDDDGNPIRRELIFYAPPNGDYTTALTTVARFPFAHETYLDHRHSVRVYGSFFLPGGAEALLASDGEDTSQITLPHVLLLWPLLKHHQSLGEELEIEECPVEFLWVVPISQAELELKLEKGTDAVLDLFETHRHPWLFDPTRKSYV
jgi:hypothetical protein